MENTPTLISTKVVIFCGGKGSRMWPVSNVGHPKQFDAILGEFSFFRQTISRVLKGFAAADVFISTGRDFEEVIKKQAPEIPQDNLIFEPQMRDNLGAVGLAAETIQKRFPDSVMILLWGADHMVKKEDVFLRALKKAAELAYKNKVMVHVDMKPEYPSIHHGWIKTGKKIGHEDGYDIVEFLKQEEKPDLTKARQFFSSGEYLIHSGYMACRPSLLLSFYKQFSYKNYQILEKISAGMGSGDYQKVLQQEYPKIEKTSVDLGIFVKLPPGTQWELPVDIGWVDLGTWELLYHGLSKDENANAIVGNVQLIDTKNSLIFAKEGKIAGVVGLENMIIVDTPQGLLVCPMEKAAKVKELFKLIYEK